MTPSFSLGVTDRGSLPEKTRRRLERGWPSPPLFFCQRSARLFQSAREYRPCPGCAKRYGRDETAQVRSEERRVGKEWSIGCRARGVKIWRRSGHSAGE